jgi:nucleolar protein 56
VNRADKHIIQSIAILDTLDKDINTFAMRVREWCASGNRMFGPG